MTTSARRKLDGRWTTELPRMPRRKLEGVPRIVLFVPTVLILIGGAILLVYWLH